MGHGGPSLPSVALKNKAQNFVLILVLIQFFSWFLRQKCLRIFGQDYEILATVQRNIGSFNDVHIIIAEKIYRRV